MLRIPSSQCSERDYTEFHYGGDAGKRRSPLAVPDLKAWHDYRFPFDSLIGSHHEFWEYLVGSWQWLAIQRDTDTSRGESCDLGRTVLTARVSVTA